MIVFLEAQGTNAYKKWNWQLDLKLNLVLYIICTVLKLVELIPLIANKNNIIIQFVYANQSNIFTLLQLSYHPFSRMWHFLCLADILV